MKTDMHVIANVATRWSRRRSAFRMLLLLMVGIFEVGRAYETWQVLTNAAREGARMSVIAQRHERDHDGPRPQIHGRRSADEALPRPLSSSTGAASINVNGTSGQRVDSVTVDYPFEFIMLQPVVTARVARSRRWRAITMRATAMMRNEAPVEKRTL